MTLKMKLAEALEWIIHVEGLSYTQVSDRTGLSRSQVYNVLKKQGEGVSSDKIWDAIMRLDTSTKIELSTENERLIP